MSVKISSGFVAAACVAALCVPVTARASSADTSQQRLEFTVVVKADAASPVTGTPSDHFMTFNRPVDIPGVGLAPGTYLFRFITPSIVQVTSPDRSIAYGMFFTTPVARTDGKPETSPEMTFERERAGEPFRIGGWFLQDNRHGVAPVYPKG